MIPSPPIRAMTAADVGEVAAIEASLQAFPWTAAQFDESLALGHQGWVAEHEGRIVAFAVSSQVLDEASLLNLGVRSEFQRQGLARRLLAQVVAHADEHGACVLLLEVRTGNQAARSLYRRSGFVAVGQRRGYYRAVEGREDAIVMALTLDEGGR